MPQFRIFQQVTKTAHRTDLRAGIAELAAKGSLHAEASPLDIDTVLSEEELEAVAQAVA